MKLSTRTGAQLGLAAAFVVLALSVSTLLLVPRLSKPVAVADVGTVAPAFELPGLNGQTFNLADTRGQVVVLFFSALNDPLSTQYYERVDHLARQYADDTRVKILAINVGGSEHLDPLARGEDGALARSVPMLLDDRAFVASRYSATQAPLMVVIDSHGVVRYRGQLDNAHTAPADAVRSALENAVLASASR